MLFSRCVQLFVTPWTRACQVLLSSTASRSWVKFMLVALMTLSNHLVLCHPLLLLPSHFPNIRCNTINRMKWPQICQSQGQLTWHSIGLDPAHQETQMPLDVIHHLNRPSCVTTWNGSCPGDHTDICHSMAPCHPGQGHFVPPQLE